MSRRLILIRHGQTTYNATGRMQGHLDTELSELGYEQARAAGRLLQDQGCLKSSPPTSSARAKLRAWSPRPLAWNSPRMPAYARRT